jgi:2-polyprenyl-3-methyl-5-hydroxy-6-metoxy-1,4-benzoquinol methylase
MPDAIFADPRLAALYDAVNEPGGADHGFYLDLAGSPPKRVLDMGCGTGVLACQFAMRGHRVTGADPADGMLEVARNRPGADTVTWVRSDAARLALAERFDLIVMTGHVFQVFLSDADIRAALSNLRAHLAPEGRIAFETRNPTVEEWREWNAEDSRETIRVAGTGDVEASWQVTGVDGAYVTFDTRYGFPDGAVSVSPSTLRFMDRDELESHLHAAGLHALDWYGDWDRSPLSASAPEIIVVAG